MKPTYVYVASSWRNPIQPQVCAALAAAGIDHYDFRNPPGGEGFSWKQVKPADSLDGRAVCEHCGQLITYATPRQMGFAAHSSINLLAWRHLGGSTGHLDSPAAAAPKKGSDWEPVGTYLEMVAHPVAVAGFESDFQAMQRADTFVMVLPCGKSAHLEIGWAVGAGKRTAILLEDPVEPELMYRMVDFMARDLDELLSWMGVQP